jgi:hypothetical protein
MPRPASFRRSHLRRGISSTRPAPSPHSRGDAGLSRSFPTCSFLRRVPGVLGSGRVGPPNRKSGSRHERKTEDARSTRPFPALRCSSALSGQILSNASNRRDDRFPMDSRPVGKNPPCDTSNLRSHPRSNRFEQAHSALVPGAPARIRDVIFCQAESGAKRPMCQRSGGGAFDPNRIQWRNHQKNRSFSFRMGRST